MGEAEQLREGIRSGAIVCRCYQYCPRGDDDWPDHLDTCEWMRAVRRIYALERTAEAGCSNGTTG